MTVVASNPPNTDRDVPQKSHDAARRLLVRIFTSCLESYPQTRRHRTEIAQILADGIVPWWDVLPPFGRFDPRESVYFLRMEVGRIHCPLKIGVSNNPEKRADAIRCGSPYEITVLATYPYALLPEWDLHQSLDRHRMRGEWFRPHRLILGLIAVIAGLPNRLLGDHAEQGPIEKSDTLRPEFFRARPWKP